MRDTITIEIRPTFAGFAAQVKGGPCANDPLAQRCAIAVYPVLNDLIDALPAMVHAELDRIGALKVPSDV